MAGKYTIEIKNKKVRFSLEVNKKFTMIKGNSATGKSYVCDLVTKDLDIVSCDVDVITLKGNDLEIISNTLRSISNSIFLIDDNSKLLRTKGFESMLLDSDNYFIIFTRKDLKALPPSLKDEYILVTSKCEKDLNAMPKYQTHMSKI